MTMPTVSVYSDRREEMRFGYREVPDGPDLEVNVFAGINRPLGGGDSFGGGLVFRLWW